MPCTHKDKKGIKSTDQNVKIKGSYRPLIGKVLQTKEQTRFCNHNKIVIEKNLMGGHIKT